MNSLIAFSAQFEFFFCADIDLEAGGVTHGAERRRRRDTPSAEGRRRARLAGLGAFARARVRPEDLAWCAERARVSSWTLDVAASLAHHVAPVWYGVEYRRRPELIHSGCSGADGLEGLWAGATWCFPPRPDVEAWLARAWEQVAQSHGPHTVGVLVPSWHPEEPWWTKLVEPYRDGRLSRHPRTTLETYLPDHRLVLHDERDNPLPAVSCVLLVLRRDGYFDGRW